MTTPIAHWTTVFDLLLRCSLQAAVLVLLILAVRLLLARRLQGRWLFALWFILLARLALPWSPVSPWSLYGILPGFAPAPATTMPGPASGPHLLSSMSAPGPAPDAPAIAANVPVPETPGAGLHAAFRGIRPVFYAAWLAGVLVLGTILLLANLAFLRVIRREPLVIDERILRLLEECKARMGVHTVLGLVASDRVRSPALYGFVRPRLLLPCRLLRTLDDNELRHIFLHELAHLKRHDILVGWLMSLLQVVHWPNPLVWLGLARMRADREVACDGLALSALGPDAPRDYGRTILHVLESFRQRQYLPALAGIVDNPSQLQRRIIMIAQPHRGSRTSTLLGMSLLLALALLTLTDCSSRRSGSLATAPADSAKDWPEAQLPEGSHIDARGRIVDRIDYPFVDDPQAVGKWESVDFVRNIEDFAPGSQQWTGDLFLRGLVLSEGGKASWAWKGWTKGLLLHDGDSTASRYVIKDIDGAAYMFLEWKSGDYTIRHRKPLYYVLRKLPAGSTRFDNAEELYAMDKERDKVELPEGSWIDANGRIIDNIDRPFVDDPQVIGRWASVDFVRNIQDFKPDSKQWGDDLFLKELVFLPDGAMPQRWLTWTSGYVLHHGGDHTAPRYTIQDIGGAKYMFFEWKSGDYIIAHRKPYYYVLKKVDAD